ncbi:Hsp33 family molecular chaperone HslO [Heliobacterium chlorum]|uniref:33 kDa chaperonin n=1 Tax=Heliobacterium chlorum TaxID=2698 RepID=A0ABR7T0F9_HELCL|nr:Hsp33 family molecular chaperone HslO [Heliobacterium chlorum]
MQDELIRATADQGKIRFIGARTTRLVSVAQQKHQTWPVATAALGRTLTASALMGSMLKAEDRMTLRILGDGPLGAIVAQGDAKGQVRGYVQNPTIELPPTPEGKLDVGRGVGKEGHIHVTRDLGLKDTFTGTSALVSGEIAEDLTHYFFTSEQTPSAVALGVLIDVDGSVLEAGGYIVQLMPGADDKTIDLLEQCIARLGPISKYLADGKSTKEMMEDLLGELDPKILNSYEPEFSCGCDRERLSALLKSFGPDELADMRREQGGAEAICHFCSEKYQFSADELLAWEQELRET